MFVDRFSQQLTIPSGLKQPEMGGGSLGFQVISTGAHGERGGSGEEKGERLHYGERLSMDSGKGGRRAVVLRDSSHV